MIDIRRNFWISLCRLFDTNMNYLIRKWELTTLLDAIGSNFSEESIDLIYISNGKNPESDGLSYDELFEAMEMRMQESKDLASKMLEESKNNRSSVATRLAFQNHVLERITQLKNCPFCQKLLTSKFDDQIVSHISRCALEDPFNRAGHLSIFFFSDYMPRY